MYSGESISGIMGANIKSTLCSGGLLFFPQSTPFVRLRLVLPSTESEICHVFVAVCCAVGESAEQGQEHSDMEGESAASHCLAFLRKRVHYSCTRALLNRVLL
eukprot:GHVU01155893.1.p1 GENE.GHVU01155893.1~~GHVU01155893.1.p1  ORF type:complete len:103 (-),score=0.96 GHVU01155893.1:286-594(-)